jgi:mannosyltransferase
VRDGPGARATLVAVAFGIAILALRAPGIGERSIWLDEALTASRALRGPGAIIGIAERNENPPLYTLLVAGWTRGFGISETALRVPSLLASAAASAWLVLLVWRLFGGEAAVYAGLLVAASDPQLFYAREARSYALLGLLCVASFSLYVRLLEQPSWPLAIGVGVVNAAAMYTHFTIGFAFVAQALCALAFLRAQRRGVALYAASQALALALFLPWLDELRDNAPTAGRFWLAPPGLAAVRALVSELAGGGLALVLSLLVVVAAAAASFSPRVPVDAQRTRRMAIAAAWAVVPIALGFIVSQRIPVFLLRYELYAVLGWIALVAASTAFLPAPRALRASLALAIAAACAAQLDWQRVRGGDWRRAVELAVDVSTPDTAIVVSPSYACVPFAYYADPEAFADPDHTLERLAARRVVCADEDRAITGTELKWPERVVALAGDDADGGRPSWLDGMVLDGYEAAGDGDLGGVRYAVLRRVVRRGAAPERSAEAGR